MGLLDKKPTTLPSAVTEIPESALMKRDEIYKTATANSHVTAPDSLISYMEGMPWAVTYYNQLIARDDVVREIDLGSSSANQQYRKINNIELRVQTAASFTYDPEKDISTVTGSAIIPFIDPNLHDYFTAEAGLNQIAIFRITQRERKTYHSKTVYFIEYALEGYVSAKPEMYDGLVSRTVQTFYFVKDRIAQNLSPLLSPDDFGNAIALKNSLKQLIRAYFSTFLDPRQRLVFYPSTDYFIYDTRLMGFLISIIDGRDYTDLFLLNQVSDDHDPNLNHSCVFTALHSRDIRDLDHGLNRVIRFSRSLMNRNSFLRSTVCWSVDYYVYPRVEVSQVRPSRATLDQYPNLPGNYDVGNWNASGEDLTQINNFPLPEVDNEVFTGPAEMEDATKHPTNTISIVNENFLLIKSVHCDDYYIFSEAFYKQTGTLSVLEMLVRDYIKREPLDLRLLNAILSTHSSWPFVEKFYYTPILVLLIKDAIRGFY